MRPSLTDLLWDSYTYTGTGKKIALPAIAENSQNAVVQQANACRLVFFKRDVAVYE